MELSPYLHDRQKRITHYMQNALPNPQQNPKKLNQALHYTVLGGGKRIRPLLVYATGESFGVAVDHLDLPACAVEFIHCYSLIHDDLPAMDNSDLRRGRPTCHIAFDEATAILTGDALLTQAFLLLAKDPTQLNRLRMVKELAFASGLHGMVAGQSLDLDNCQLELSLEDLKNIYQKKTGALIKASIILGALAFPDIDEEQLRILAQFGEHLGLAFQIIDDILDVTCSDLSGKPQHLDQNNGKLTFVSQFGVEHTRMIAKHEVECALQYLGQLKIKHRYLEELARYIFDRDF